MAPVWLIAGREFRAYTATASFWFALGIGPVIAALILLFMQASHNPRSAPLNLQVTATSSADAASLRAAVEEVARLEKVAGKSEPVRVALTPTGELVIDPALGLSPSGRALVMRTLERDRLAAAASVAAAPALRLQPPPPAPDRYRTAARFALVMMLWLTLTGSLGMLLQAVVRERTNRALEILLAAAQPWEVVLGKLAGVGLVSTLVLGSWLVSAAVPAAIGLRQGGGEALRIFADPGLLLGSAALYVLAFLLYGLAIIAVGARARDNASAQNMSRPVFAILLAVFFVILGSLGGGLGRLAWLVYLPPFTPFLLIGQSHSAAVWMGGLAGIALCSLAAGWAATSSLSMAIAGGQGDRRHGFQARARKSTRD